MDCYSGSKDNPSNAASLSSTPEEQQQAAVPNADESDDGGNVYVEGHQKDVPVAWSACRVAGG